MIKEKTSISKKIKQAMFDSDLTQQQLADIIKTDRGLISSWTLGKRNPTIKSLKKIAKATNKPLHFFLDTEENMDSSIETENKNLKKELKLRDELIDFLKEEIKKLKSEMKNKNNK